MVALWDTSVVYSVRCRTYPRLPHSRQERKNTDRFDVYNILIIFNLLFKLASVTAMIFDAADFEAKGAGMEIF